MERRLASHADSRADANAPSRVNKGCPAQVTKKPKGQPSPTTHPLRVSRVRARRRLISTPRRVGESITIPNGIMILAPPLPIIRRIARRPRLTVKRAVLAHALSTIVQHIRVEELARLRLAVTGRVREIVLRLRRAGRSAQTGVKGARREDLDAHVGVVARAVEGRVDGGVAEGDGAGVACGSGDAVVDVAVGARDDDVEVVAPLAVVGGGGGGDGAAVVDAFDYCGAGGFGAGAGWVDAGVAFVVWWWVSQCVGVAGELQQDLQMLTDEQPSMASHSAVQAAVSYELSTVYPM